MGPITVVKGARGWVCLLAGQSGSTHAAGPFIQISLYMVKTVAPEANQGTVCFPKKRVGAAGKDTLNYKPVYKHENVSTKTPKPINPALSL